MLRSKLSCSSSRLPQRPFLPLAKGHPRPCGLLLPVQAQHHSQSAQPSVQQSREGLIDAQRCQGASTGLAPWVAQHGKTLVIGGLAALAMIHCAPALAADATVVQPSLTDIFMDKCITLLSKVSSLHVAFKVLCVLASTAPAVLLFGAIYSAITSVDYHAACIKMYALFNKLPGMQVLNEKTIPAAILVNVAFIFGTFFFAILLGVVTDEIKQTLRNFRNGYYQINQSDHCVILNWNQQSIPLLRQIDAARKAGHPLFNRPVAVLAEMPKAEMDAAIRSRLKGIELEIITRNGNPTVPRDLASVAAARAAAFIVLMPESKGTPAPASFTAQAAVSLAAASPKLASQTLIFQAPKEHIGEHVTAFKRLTGLGSNTQMLRFSDSDLVDRMLTLSALQPGMQRVVMHLLGQGNLHVLPIPSSLVGCTYQHARRMYADGVLCGLLQGESSNLLVPESQVLKSTDQFIMLSPVPDVEINSKAEPVFLRAAEGVVARLAKSSNYKSAPRNILAICVDTAEISKLSEVFSQLAPKGSSVTFLTPRSPSTNVPSRKGNCSFRVITPEMNIDQFCNDSTLRDAGIGSCTAVIVTGLHALPGSRDVADAFVAATLLQVQDSVQASGRKVAPHFVAQVAKASTQSSLTSFLKVVKQGSGGSGAVITRPDLFLSDDLQAAVLAYTADKPAFASLVQDVLDHDGAEVYFRNPQVFNLATGDLLTFADVAETTRMFDETAIGAIRADGSVLLAPEPTYPLNFQAGDRVIVFAKEYTTSKAKRS